MGRRIRAKAKDPQVAAADRRLKAFEEVGLPSSAATLPANDDIDAQRANRASAEHRGNVERARRLDAFEALKGGFVAGGYDAVKALAKQIAIARGEGDRGRSYMRVDCDEPLTDHDDAMIAARRDVNRQLNAIGDRDALLLCELIDPSPATRLQATTWRDIAGYITGEETPHGQAAAVRASVANLVMARNRVLCAA